MTNANVIENRHMYIGGSCIPIIMNKSYFKKRYNLMLEKAQIDKSEFIGNKYTEYGNILEPVIRDYINKEYNRNFIESSDIYNNVRINTDGFDTDCVLEIKTTSQIRKKVTSYKTYLMQLLFYMHYKGVRGGILAVYDRPKDFNQVFDKERLQVFKIDINDYQELLDSILLECDKFWKQKERLEVEYIFGKLLTEEELENEF